MTGESKEPDTSRWPTIVQGSGAPVFRGEVPNAANLACFKCGHILIEHFYPDCFVGIQIECFRCKHLTPTTALDDGDVMCSRVIVIDEGRCLIGQTVNTPTFVTMASRDFSNRELFAEPNREGFTLDFSDSELTSLIASYDEIVGNKFALQRSKLERGGYRNKTMFPFAWAVHRISSCLKNGTIDLRDKEILSAFICLRLYANVVRAWRHHPRFMNVARDLGKQGSFFHTAGQLLLANILSPFNRIGLSLENRHGEPNPDLYLKGINSDRFYIEVKAPVTLGWSASITNPSQIYSAVANQIDQSRKQINGQNKGVLAIFSTRCEVGFSAILGDAVKTALDRVGAIRRHLAGVVILWPEPGSIVPNGHSVEGPTIMHKMFINEQFAGENPINTKPLPIA